MLESTVMSSTQTVQTPHPGSAGNSTPLMWHCRSNQSASTPLRTSSGHAVHHTRSSTGVVVQQCSELLQKVGQFRPSAVSACQLIVSSRDQRPAKCPVARRRARGASCELPILPPVSMPTTTSWRRSLSRSSTYLVFSALTGSRG